MRLVAPTLGATFTNNLLNDLMHLLHPLILYDGIGLGAYSNGLELQKDFKEVENHLTIALGLGQLIKLVVNILD